MVLGIFSNCREELAPLQKVEYTFKCQSSYIIAVESMFTGHHYSHWFRPIGCAPPETVRLERPPCPISHFILSGTFLAPLYQQQSSSLHCWSHVEPPGSSSLVPF